jgi:acyl carrier protein
LTMNIDEIKRALKEVIVRECKLPIKPEEIASDRPLFGEGLGLDSVEALSITSGIEQRFEVVIEDVENIQEVFRTVNTLAQLVEKLLAEKKAKA